MAAQIIVVKRLIVCSLLFLLLFSYTQTTKLKTIFNASLFKELPWTIKIRLLNNFHAEKNQSQHTTTEPGFQDIQGHRRMPPIESLVLRQPPEDSPKPTGPPKHPTGQGEQEQRDKDDNNMRIKLFRLMYETIRDSDAKCKRAELIMAHYVNSTVFELGFLTADVMDKFKTMSDISVSLKRLYSDWKPIEHINAYEQISNHAIEINHLVDLMRSLSKKNETILLRK